MPRNEKYSPHTLTNMATTPFDCVEEAWFWFVQAQSAKEDGARFVMGKGLVPRPCEPLDILKVLDRLYRNRLLIIDHIMVLRHYGKRLMAPDPRRPREIRASKLWEEALKKMEEPLMRKGIIRKNNWAFEYMYEAAE